MNGYVPHVEQCKYSKIYPDHVTYPLCEYKMERAGKNIYVQLSSLRSF